MSDETIELKDQGLKQLLKAFRGDLPKARVGILGKSAARRDESSNASIGAKHEFGDTNLPIRSFLRMPITDELQNFLAQSGAFTKETLDEVVKQGSIGAWMDQVGISAVQVVLTAFDTGGFGKWKPSQMAHKKTKQTLVETQQLKDSITSEVK